MRDDIAAAIDDALTLNLRDGRGEPMRVEVPAWRRAAFVTRLRLFLVNCPDDLTIDELRDEVGR